MMVFLGILSLYFFLDPTVYNFFPKCPFLRLTGFQCPGCGSQRAVHQILRGNLLTGIRHNYLFLVLFLVLGYQLLIFFLNKYSSKKHTNLLHKSALIKAIAIIIILFWVFRNIPIFPFTELAP